MLRKQRAHRVAVSKVSLLETEIRLREQHIETGLLQRNVVIGIKVIESDDAMTVRHQLAGDKIAYKASRPGNQYGLIRHCIPGLRVATAASLATLWMRSQ